MKLWIIYKNGIGFSKFLAETLQDRLEDYIDVNVGKVKNIEPSYLIEEKVDFLIVGDLICEKTPNLELKNWLLNYMDISNQKNHLLQFVSGYYVKLDNIAIKPSWIEILQNNIKSKKKLFPILHLELDREVLKLDNKAYDLLKSFSKSIIEYIIGDDI